MVFPLNPYVFAARLAERSKDMIRALQRVVAPRLKVAPFPPLPDLKAMRIADNGPHQPFQALSLESVWIHLSISHLHGKDEEECHGSGILRS